jgi:hypothetical protein
VEAVALRERALEQGPVACRRGAEVVTGGHCELVERGIRTQPDQLRGRLAAGQERLGGEGIEGPAERFRLDDLVRRSVDRHQ